MTESLLQRSLTTAPVSSLRLRSPAPAVRENLMFACKLYSPELSQAKCDIRVDQVLASLGLESCQHTKVILDTLTE